MGRPAKYPEEFRRDAVELCRTSGRPIADVARSLGITVTGRKRLQRGHSSEPQKSANSR